jgi:hypothetical protein
LNATLFALLCNAMFGLVVFALILILRRLKLAPLAYYGGVFLGTVALWALLWLVVSLVEPRIALTGEGHAGVGFGVPFVMIGAAIILFAPLLAYGLRTPNSSFESRRSTSAAQLRRYTS